MSHNTAVGIDVSKISLDLTLIKDSKSYHKKFKNSHDGVKSIIKMLKSNSFSNKSQIVIESTGDYHLLSAYLLSKNFNVRVINPLIAKHHMSTTIRKIKTDKVDSHHLAEIGLKQDLPTVNITKDTLKKQKLVVFIDTLEKHISALKLTLKNLKSTLASFDLKIDTVLEVNDQIRGLEKSLKKAHEELYELVNQKDKVNELAGVCGVSIHTATKIVAMLEDKTFNKKGGIVAFAGLDISVKESGFWRGKTKLSKRGNSQLRKYLIQIGWGLLMHNEYFQRYIESYKQRGRKYKELLVIIARKFLKMFYGSLKNNEPFNIEMI